MKSSSMIVLFGEPVTSRRGPSGFLVSAVVHACAFLLLIAGLHRPRQVDLRSDQRYTVRVMELHDTKPIEQRPAPKAIEFPGHETPVPTPGGAPAAVAAERLPSNLIQQKHALQTLIQPEVRHDILIPQTPLPQVLEWTAPQVIVTRIVPPAPKPAAAINVKPTLETPNQESHVADVNVSSSPFETKAPLPAPSKTSPVAVKASEQAQRIPETSSKSSAAATPASVISLSDVQLQQGTAVLPMISEVAPTPYTGSLSPGQPNGTAPAGNGKADTKSAGAGAGQTSGYSAGAASGASGTPGQGSGVNTLPGDTGLNTGGGRSIEEISQPKGGRFGVVVVGSSLAEDYPETVDVWRGRLAYTVYLHVGTAKNWIMQYSLPRSKEATSPGILVGRPDAPWPYDMTRPSIDAGVNANAIMVHGFVNALGRFEQLAIVFPTELAETKFLLHALQQWQFRPASQNGVPTSVEVLLIIPTAE